jgi:hypothetical protein
MDQDGEVSRTVDLDMSSMPLNQFEIDDAPSANNRVPLGTGKVKKGKKMFQRRRRQL